MAARRAQELVTKGCPRLLPGEDHLAKKLAFGHKIATVDVIPDKVGGFNAFLGQEYVP